MRYLIFTILTLLFSYSYNPTVHSDYFAAPVKIPLLLAGNFGELRTNHFHTGIDIKTQGKTGIPVYMPAEGDISRIRVSSGGYGLALYVDHPGGYTTVYGHLSRLNKTLAAFVKKRQYEEESFDIDLTIPKGRFTFTKGELIAYTGNSGSSGGPHLHFEIRDTRTEHPLNPLLFNFDIKDDIAPKLLSVMLYPIGDGAHINGTATQKPFEIVSFDGAYHLKGSPTITAGGEIGFGLQTLDYLSGTWSKCGIYEIGLTVNDELIYSFKMNELSFDEGRYINSHIDYTYLRKTGRRYQKNWVEDGNKLSNYPSSENGGKLKIAEGKEYDVSYLVKDVYGNASRLNFKLTGKSTIAKTEQIHGIPVRYNQDFEIENENTEADIDAGTFYSSFLFDYNELPKTTGLYSKRIQLHRDEIPVHQSFKLRIKTEGLPANLESKALIAAIDVKTGKKYAQGGKYSNGWVEASIRQLGTFAVTTDEKSPSIVPVNIQNQSTLMDKQKVSFKLLDDLSGVASYRGEIDGQWVLFEYDAKNNLIEYYFDAERLQLGKRHELVLSVKDAVGNERKYQANFYR